MSEPVIFEICFPAHITRAPVCRPGETIAGVVVLKLSSPLMASHMVLKFCGMERVRRTPVAQRTAATATSGSKKQQQQQTTAATMSQKMVMDKEFFRREIILWGSPQASSLRSVPSDTAHRFHFSFTMPYVNMPTPRQTADVEISYSLMASLFTEAAADDAPRGALHDYHKTSSKCFHFEPVIQQRISHGAAAAGPLESIVALKDAPTGSSSSSSSSSSFSIGGGKTHLNLHVFHPTPAYLPGELVELLVLAPAGKKIVSAAFQLRENVRCRKSSAPIIDESDVPLLWRYAVDLTPPQEMAFAKLSKTSITQDVGMLGRYMFTCDAASAAISRSRSGKASVVMAAAAATAGADYGQRPAAAPLSPLAEAQELLPASAGSSTRTLDEAAAMRGRAGSLGVLLQPVPPQQQQQPAAAAGVVSPAQSRPRQPSTTTPALALALALSGVQGGGGASSRLSQSLSTTGESILLDDSRSERSSASDALSIRYQGGSSFGSKLLSGNFPSLSRGVSSHSAAAAASALTAALPKYNLLSVTPVPLGPLLAKGSYRFAKIQFTLPPITDMSPVSSVFLDFDYTVDITMTLGGSFGSTKKASGKLPLKIVTIRTAAKASAPPTEGTLRNSALLSDHPVALSNATAAGSAERRGSSNTDESTASLRDSMSCLNLSIANSEDNANLGTISAATAMMAAAAAANRNGSPVNTLNEFHFESNLPGIINGSKRLSTGADTLSSDDSYPCLRSFVQNGEKVPMPELEIIRIGTATI